MCLYESLMDKYAICSRVEECLGFHYFAVYAEFNGDMQSIVILRTYNYGRKFLGWRGRGLFLQP